MSRYVLVALMIVFGLALLGLSLVRAQAQPTEGTLPHKDAASCVTVCPLPGEGGHLMGGQPLGSETGARTFRSADFGFRVPAEESLLGRYLPVTLRSVAPGIDPGADR